MRSLHFPTATASYISTSEERTWLVVGAVRHLEPVTLGSCLIRLNLLHILERSRFFSSVTTYKHISVSVHSPRLAGQAVAGCAQEVYPTGEGEDEVAEAQNTKYHAAGGTYLNNSV